MIQDTQRYDRPSNNYNNKACHFHAGFVANLVIHSNQMWRDLRYFYIMVKAFEKIMKIKKASKRVTLLQNIITFTLTSLHIYINFTITLIHV